MQALIEALHHGCAACSVEFKDGHRIVAVYQASNIRAFAQQVELGIIGQEVRNHWKHVDCSNVSLRDYDMTPDVNHCIRCRKAFDNNDFLCPTFLVVDPRAVNPNDPTDVGIALNERVYMIHADCTDPKMTGKNTSLLYKP